MLGRSPGGRRRKRQPTPAFLPGESQGRGSLVGCRLWGCTESDTTEATEQQQLPHIQDTGLTAVIQTLSKRWWYPEQTRPNELGNLFPTSSLPLTLHFLPPPPLSPKTKQNKKQLTGGSGQCRQVRAELVWLQMGQRCSSPKPEDHKLEKILNLVNSSQPFANYSLLSPSFHSLYQFLSNSESFYCNHYSQ